MSAFPLIDFFYGDINLSFDKTAYLTFANHRTSVLEMHLKCTELYDQLVCSTICHRLLGKRRLKALDENNR